MEKQNLTQEWDKVFPKSDKVDHKKVTFHNRYGITLAADMYTPKSVAGKLPAIAVSGPFGAVKEQSSGLYAQKMAELGFLTIAFDPSYTGESGGTPRYVASPDINTEDFCAAVDFLSVQENIDPERIGINHKQGKPTPDGMSIHSLTAVIVSLQSGDFRTSQVRSKHFFF